MSADRTTEILNYLSATSRDVGELRAEVQANGQGIELRTSVDELRAGVRANGQGIEDLRTEMRAGFGAVRTDIRHLARKVELLSNDSLDLRASQRDLEVRMDAFESKQT